jgi:hypothetical protein
MPAVAITGHGLCVTVTQINPPDDMWQIALTDMRQPNGAAGDIYFYVDRASLAALADACAEAAS